MICIRRFVAALVTALIVGSGLTACGGSDDSDVTYSPAAYGEVVGGQGLCYFDQDPYEAQQLLATGMCPAGWIPYQMPTYWHQQYYGYYSSPAYYNRYVLVSRRTVYVTHETTFHTTYSTQITAASKAASYRGSNGKTVSGSKVGTAKFGGGSARQQTYGGGSGRANTTGGTGSKSGSYGGGSGRSSTSGGGSAGRR
jgi:hypothetical protein